MLSTVLAAMGTTAGTGGASTYIPGTVATLRIGRYKVLAMSSARAATSRATLPISAAGTAGMATVWCWRGMLSRWAAARLVLIRGKVAGLPH